MPHRADLVAKGEAIGMANVIWNHSQNANIVGVMVVCHGVRTDGSYYCERVRQHGVYASGEY